MPRIFLVSDDFNAWVDRVVNRPSFRENSPKRHALRQFYAKKASYGKPMKVGRLHHSGFLGKWNDLVARTSALTAGDDHDNDELQEARDLCFLLFRAMSLHAKFENLVLFPALDAAKGHPGFTAEAVEQHAREAGDMNSLLDSLLHAVEPDSDEWRRLLIAMHGYLTAEHWLRVVRRFEGVLSTSLMVVPIGHRRQTIGSAARALQAAAPVDRIEIPPPPSGLARAQAS